MCSCCSLLVNSGCRSAQEISIKQFEENAFVPSEGSTAYSKDSLLTIKLVVNKIYCFNYSLFEGHKAKINYY